MRATGREQAASTVYWKKRSSQGQWAGKERQLAQHQLVVHRGGQCGHMWAPGAQSNKHTNQSKGREPRDGQQC